MATKKYNEKYYKENKIKLNKQSIDYNIYNI